MANFIESVLTMLTGKDKIISVADMARKGGLASAAKMTPEQRRKRAAKAAKARWSKRRKKDGEAH
mgnify:CR=1 FL=1